MNYVHCQRSRAVESKQPEQGVSLESLTNMARPLLMLIALLIVLMVVMLGAWFPVLEWIEWTRSWIQGLGPWGIIAFVVLFSVVTVLMIPALPLTLLAGLIYGIWGFPLVMLSATLAACLAFVLARSLLHTTVSTLMQDKIIYVAIKRAVTREEWKITILLRMSPILSFAMQNYLLAISDIRFWPYAAGSAIGMTPAIAFYVYLGSLGSLSTELSEQWVILVVGVVATVTIFILISYRTKQAINEIKNEYQHK